MNTCACGVHGENPHPKHFGSAVWSPTTRREGRSIEAPSRLRWSASSARLRRQRARARRRGRRPVARRRLSLSPLVRNATCRRAPGRVGPREAGDPRRLPPVSGNELKERACLLTTQLAVEHASWLYGFDADDDLEVVQRARAPSTAGLIGGVHHPSASRQRPMADSSLAVSHAAGLSSVCRSPQTRSSQPFASAIAPMRAMSGSSSDGGGSVRLSAGWLISRTSLSKPPGVQMNSILQPRSPTVYLWGMSRGPKA